MLAKASKRIMTFEDLIGIKRVSEPTLHPSGKQAAYVLTEHDKNKNTTTSRINIVDLETGVDRCITPGPWSSTNPSWSKNGDLAFVSDRGGEKQVWVLPFDKGGEARCITTGEGGAEKPLWCHDNRRIAFSRTVVFCDGAESGGTDGEDGKMMEHAKRYGLANDISSARIEDSLLYRHWDSWREKTRKHLFIVDIDTGDMHDITPWDSDVPPISLGGVRDYDFSPCGKEIAYVRNPDPVVAESVNNSIWIQGLEDIKPLGEPVNISLNRALECNPRYSPNGEYIAFLGGEREGYEADRLEVKLFNRKTRETKRLTSSLDRSAHELVWTHNSQNILFSCPDHGRNSIYKAQLEDGEIKQITATTFNHSIVPMPDERLLVARESAVSPADLFIMPHGEGCTPKEGNEATHPGILEDGNRITSHGSLLGEQVELRPLEEIRYNGADGDIVHGFILKPPGFTEDKRYPCILLIHGGPQSAFSDNFNYRWNPQLFASRGYVVLMFNPRGSTGYGQTFTDQISGDWGGRCYQDIMMGLEHCLQTYAFIDANRLAAAGASFGGFMINWIEGHDNPFKALVSHDGIFNAENMAYMTDELWFDKWEHGGMPHENTEGYRKYSPHTLVKNFKTPCLIIQGEQDFRCTVSEGLAMFTALQTMGVPSRLLYFPDEGHWVLKPANAEVWYDTAQGFIDEHIQGNGKNKQGK